MFTGFSNDTVEFLRELAANNTRHWFEANRDRYERAIRVPAEAFIETLGPVLSERFPGVHYDTRRNGAGSLMRINRDVRFSPDKRPYKENVGIVFWIGEGKKVERPGFYFHIGVDAAFFYGGQHMFPKEVLERYRDAVDTGRTGPELPGILDHLHRDGLVLYEEPQYKRVPRGYPTDHPRATLLRYKGMGAARPLQLDELTDSTLVERCASTAAALTPLVNWLLAINTSAQ